MKVAILTTDSREHYKDYGATVPSFGAAPEALLQGFANLSGVEVHVISCAKARMSSPEKLAPNIFFHGLYVGKWAWMRSLYQGCIRATRRKLRQIGPDIVHGQGTEKDCALEAVFSGFPNVVTIHGNMAELARLFGARIGSFAWLAARLEDLSLKRTEGVFCNSKYTEELVRPRARQTWRVANAVREVFFLPTTSQSQRTSHDRGPGCILLNVGLVTPRKRQVELLEVAQRLRARGLDFQLWFLGHAEPTNPYARKFLDLIRPLGAEGRIRHLGLKGVDALIDSFDQASALVHFPSEEAFGLVIAEALARGLMLFAAKTGGIIDICNGVPDAKLFDVGDWDGLTEAIAKWIQAGSPRMPSGAELMRARYHPEVIAKQHLEIYHEVPRPKP
jgi:glycosyltransferase involved in cell wall biosynthesis